SYSPHTDTTKLLDEEPWKEYRPGGYHPVHIGETFSDGRYVVVRKLGWGHFSTVWLVRDTKLDRHVALKIVKSGPMSTETALDEIKLLQCVVSSSLPPNPPHPGGRHILGLLDHFKHVGPNGTHVCIVSEVLGENLLNLIRRYQNKGLPLRLVKQIAKQLLLGLDYTHRQCGMIHTDLKPENILISIEDVESVIRAELGVNREGNGSDKKLDSTMKVRYALRFLCGSHAHRSHQDSTSPSPSTSRSTSRSTSPSPTRSHTRSTDPDRITIKIADLGNANWTTHHFTDNIQSREYRAPEAILYAPWSSTVDMWSVACLVFELLTGDFLFDPYPSGKNSRNVYSEDEDHLAQMIELLGPLPKRIALSGKLSSDFFNSRGELRHITKLRSWPLQDLLYDKYLFTREEAERIASFLLPMLRYDPDKRAGAGEMVHHVWLEGVIVEGEVDMLK
ncbi:hypothetical protein M422DRAFT_141011, partial [Sphaerobolus stellatus SS14]